MTATPKTKRPATKHSTAKRPAVKMPAKQPTAPPRKNGHPPKARPRHIEIDWSRSDAFLRLPLEERQRRTEAFRSALAPAFADYSSDDFRADQRREAERD